MTHFPPSPLTPAEESELQQLQEDRRAADETAVARIQLMRSYACDELVVDDYYNLGATRYTCNVGMGILSRFKFLIGVDVTIELEDGRKKTWARDTEGRPSRIQLDLSDEDLKNTESVEFVASTGFDGELTVDRETAERLGLQEIPGYAFLRSVWSPNQEPIKCTKAMARIRVPSLDLDLTVTAAVMPFDGPLFIERF